MSEDMKAELQHWQARTDEMQVAIERLREDRDNERNRAVALEAANQMLTHEVKQLRSMIERVQVAMSQGQEL
jgi:predicted  nucleic acid-binding Zn-ribbon protein